MRLHAGFSVDGINWEINEEDVKFTGADPEVAEWVYGYDPRVTLLDGKYYVTWCNGYHGPTIGVAWTTDFEVFHQVENAFLPYNRNGVLFPKKIGGKFAMLSRPSDTGHTAFGDIFYSESPDLEYWGHHRHVMAPAPFEVSAWQCMKIGAGPVPIETPDGHSCSIVGYNNRAKSDCPELTHVTFSANMPDGVFTPIRDGADYIIVYLDQTKNITNFDQQNIKVCSLATSDQSYRCNDFKYSDNSDEVIRDDYYSYSYSGNHLTIKHLSDEPKVLK